MTNSLQSTAILFAGLIAYAAPLHAQQPACPQMQHEMTTDGPLMRGNAPANEADKAYAAATMKMHRDMTQEFTGNADEDFVRGMIPHHRGAIDMAKIALKYGKDPEIRALAEAIVKAQDSEIAFMKAWLSKNAK